MTNSPAAVRPVVALDEIPRLGGLYAQAVGRQVQTAIRRNPRIAELPDLAYEVSGVRADAAHLTAYQHLLGMRAADELPAGYVHVLGFPLAVAIMARPDFPLPLLGMVHASNHVTQTRALQFGEDLTVRAWAQNLSAHRSGTQVELVVEVTGSATTSSATTGTALTGSAHPAPAWRGVSTYLARGVKLPGLPDAPERARDESKNPAPTAIWRLGAGVGRAYARVSGDINPIHMSALSAKLFGFPRAIAHGMYTSARALAEVGPHSGEAFTWTVDFASPVLLPGKVKLAITEKGTGSNAGTDTSASTGTPAGTGPTFAYRGWGTKLNFTGEVIPA